MTTKKIDAQYDGARWTARLAPANASEQLVLVLAEAGCATIAVKPPEGGSVTVEMSAGSRQSIEADEADWFAAPGLGTDGVVTAKALHSVFTTITAVRVTASDAGASVDVAQ